MRQTLMALADACQQIGSPETEIFLLRWALDVDPKDPVVNRRAAIGVRADGAVRQRDRLLAARASRRSRSTRKRPRRSRS